MPDAIADAFVVIRPDLTGFKAQLQSEVDAAARQARASVPIAAGGLGSTAASLGATGAAARTASKDLTSAATGANAAKGALIGLSRVTPVTVFGLGVAGTAALAAGLAIKSAIAATADFEHQLNIFQATSGATADQMQLISDRAKELGADLTLPAVSAGDAALGMTELVKAGLSVNDTLAASRAVLQLSAAAQISVGDAANFTATQLNAFGLAGDQAVHVADLLAGASIAAQGEITDFAFAFQQVSAVSHQVDLSLETTTGALVELARAGLKGADGGTSLRTALLRLAPTTKQAADFQKALGIEIDHNRSIGEQLPDLLDQYKESLKGLDAVQQQQALTQIFGQDAIRAATILIQGGSAALDKATAAADRNGAAAKLAEANSLGLKGAFEGLKSNAETLGITIGGVVKGPLTDFVKSLSDGVTTAGDLITKMGELKQSFKDIPVVGGGGGGKGGGGLPGAIGRLFTPGTTVVKNIDDFLTVVNQGGYLKVGETPADALKRINAEKKAKKNLKKAVSEGQFGVSGFLPSQGLKEQVATGQFGITELGSGIKLTAEQKKRKKAVQDLIAGKKEDAQTEKDIRDSLAPNKLQITQLNAQISGSLQQELAADQLVRSYFEKRLESAKEGTKRYITILSALAQADSAVRSVQSQIQSQKEAHDAEVAADLKKAEEERKRLAKEAQDAIDKAKADELARFKLGQSELDLAIQAAGLTETKVDDARAINKKIDRIKKRIALLNKVKKQTTEEKQAVIDLRSEILSLRSSLKSLKDDNGGGGFSLQDLFKEAVNQLNEFGSNISPSVVTPGGARGALAGAILAQRPQDKTDVVGRLIARINDEQLSEASKSNDLLAGILEAVGGKAGGRRGGKDTVGPAGFATAAHARKRARVRGN